MRKPTAPVSDNNSSGKGSCFVGIFSLQRGLVGWVFFYFVMRRFGLMISFQPSAKTKRLMYSWRLDFNI